MEEFDEDALSKLTQLCRIACTKEEKQKLHSQINAILDYIKQLDEVDTEGVEPCYCVLEHLSNVMREDVVGGLLSKEQFLANAPAHVGGMIRVPTVIQSANP